MLLTVSMLCCCLTFRGRESSKRARWRYVSLAEKKAGWIGILESVCVCVCVCVCVGRWKGAKTQNWNGAAPNTVCKSKLAFDASVVCVCVFPWLCMCLDVINANRTCTVVRRINVKSMDRMCMCYDPTWTYLLRDANTYGHIHRKNDVSLLIGGHCGLCLHFTFMGSSPKPSLWIS